MTDNKRQGSTVSHLVSHQTQRQPDQAGHSHLHQGASKDMEQAESQRGHQDRRQVGAAESVELLIQKSPENKFLREGHCPHTIDNLIQELP